GNNGLLSTLWYAAKQLLVWHNAETLEEKPVVSGVHGMKLQSATTLLEKAAEVRNPDAMFLLAEMNFYGNWSTPRDYKTAYKWYKELADTHGNHTAQHMVGFMHATGIGGAVKKDQGMALLYHTFAASAGNTRSQMTIAFRYYQGIGTPRNCEEAVYNYQHVALKAIKWWESGPPGGHYLEKHASRLADDKGGVYGEGASVSSTGANRIQQKSSLDNTKDLGDIVDYLELLARKGNLPETISLGKIYYEGSKNLPRNIPKAKEYFKRVAHQYWDNSWKVRPGSPQYLEKFAGRAAGHLGHMALRGEGGPQDLVMAQRWFRLGVACGDANSQTGLGLMYYHGLGVKEDRTKASKYFKAATTQDFPVAQVNYAKILLDNNSIDQAKRYLELAARHGNVEAFFWLAEINNNAIAEGRSCGIATAYYKIVAERIEPIQSPMAWANSAYRSGDLESALIGYLMAAEQGYESAQANVAYLLDPKRSALPLKTLQSYLTPSSASMSPAASASAARNEHLALTYWTRSAKQANVDSLVKMGDYYLSGIGCEPDPAKAASCYNAAAEHQASAQALWNLGWMHENGIGVSQDFHLAKRYYDQAFETNPEAYLPVALSLLKLRVRAFWNSVTNGGVNGIGPDPKKKQVTFREFLRNWYEAARNDEQVEEQQGQQTLPEGYGNYEEEVEDWDEDFAESLVILALAGVIAALVYYRQWRAQRQAREAADNQAAGRGPVGPAAGNPGNAGNGNGNPAAGLNDGGLWGEP
ncbi:hypothetical protein BZA77DRAFT_223796, partial [Pyronema omphalodes]